MKVLFATGRHYLPDRVGGGANTSVHALLRGLADAGHECEAVAQLGPGPRYHALRLFRRLSGGGRSSLADLHNGYVTRRGVSWGIGELVDQRLRAFRPDLLLTQLDQSEEIARRALARATPIMLRFCDVEFAHFTGKLAGTAFQAIANSEFVARRLRDRFGMEAEVIYPAIRAQAYRAIRHQPEYVTFVNPSRLKGLDLAIEVAARLPRRKFLFQESWPMDHEERAEVRRRLSPLPNVTLEPVTRDMRGVYGRTALLLVPSRWEEAFARVVVEAHMNGIPVLATRIGGIPESLADGGRLFEPEAGAAAWAEAVERLLSDDAHYARLSERALANAGRPEFDPTWGVARFIEIAERHVARHRGAERATPAAASSYFAAAARVPS